jgi:alpha-L-arabinofuranosidase
MVNQVERMCVMMAIANKANRALMVSCIGMLCLNSVARGAERKVSYTLDPTRVLNRIDPKVYGHFFEHIYHSANGGLWGEQVWNRSFEENAAGRWSVENEVINQGGMGTDQRLVLGDRSWTDYEFSLEAQKTGGSEGFLIIFRETSPQVHYWYNLGGWGNTRHQLEKAGPGRARGVVGPAVRGGIDTGKWYRIRVRCEHSRIQIWLNDKQLLDFTDTHSPNLQGRVGVGTWATMAKYRNLRVTTLDGRALLQGPPPKPKAVFAAKHWDMFGAGTAEVVSDHALNSRYCVRIKGAKGQTGLKQDSFRIKADETYEGSLWARGTGARGLVVRLVKGKEKIAEQRLKSPGPKWRELKFQLQPQVSDANATLQVAVRGQADIHIDQISMMPRSWKDAGGFRPDLLKAVADIKAPIIRWPGGCFASPYRWKDGIGPQALRRVTRRELWDDLDINSLGTDEFIALCRKVGAEPLIVVNIGTPQWNTDADTYDFLQDALDWMEYCNAPADSKWGKIRAANGHPEPYDVKYWEIDNETWGMGVENYIEAIKRFAPAMRSADPSIRLAACGSGGFDLNWNRAVIEGCAELIDYISIHHYENPDRFAQGPYAYERFIQQTGEIISRSKNPRMTIYCSEWNAQSTDWRTGLYAGGVLNAFERCGDIFEIGGPALFLRHVSARAWDNAFINFDQSSWFPAPNYVVMQLWRRHYAPERIALEGSSEVLNTIATKSRDGKTLYFKCVNAEKSAMELSLNLAAGRIPKNATLELVAPGSLAARNTLDHPHAICAQPRGVRLQRGTIEFILPALSAGVVKIEL